MTHVLYVIVADVALDGLYKQHVAKLLFIRGLGLREDIFLGFFDLNKFPEVS
jgi:hypothetical protein